MDKNLEFLAIIGLCLIPGIFSVQKSIPSYIKKCNTKPELELKNCLWENVEIVRPHLKEGIPEMGIPGLDPLLLPKVSMEIPGFQAAFINASVYDSTNFVLKDFIFNINDNFISLNMMLPMIRLLGDYEISGKILLLQLNGHGYSSANISNLIAHLETRGVKEIKNDQTYINFNETKMKLTVGGAKVHFDNIFGRNKELNEVTNTLINENIDDFITELLPIVEQTVAAFVFPLIKHIFKSFSLEELFLDYKKP